MNLKTSKHNLYGERIGKRMDTCIPESLCCTLKLTQHYKSIYSIIKNKQNPKATEQVWCAGGAAQDPGALSRPPEGAESTLAENPLAKRLQAPHYTQRGWRAKLISKAEICYTTLTARIQLVRNPRRSKSGQNQHHLYRFSHPPSYPPNLHPCCLLDPLPHAGSRQGLRSREVRGNGGHPDCWLMRQTGCLASQLLHPSRKSEILTGTHRHKHKT